MSDFLQSYYYLLRKNKSMCEDYENFDECFNITCNFSNMTILVVDNCNIDILYVETLVNLERLICRNNNLTILDLSNNKLLTHIDCSNNKLSTLDLSNNELLTHFNCSNNNLNELNLTNLFNIVELIIYRNNLTEIIVEKSDNLTHLHCSNNKFSNYYQLMKNFINIKKLNCYNNLFSSLELSINPKILELNCHGNLLSTNEIINILIGVFINKYTKYKIRLFVYSVIDEEDNEILLYTTEKYFNNRYNDDFDINKCMDFTYYVPKNGNNYLISYYFNQKYYENNTIKITQDEEIFVDIIEQKLNNSNYLLK
jgi:Leucine-rich repeat (LRR) protein